jgi:hypothetical protein
MFSGMPVLRGPQNENRDIASYEDTDFNEPPMNITRRSACNVPPSFPSALLFRHCPTSRPRGCREEIACGGGGTWRGMGHVQALLSLPDVEIAYLAEVDPARLERGLKTVAAKQQTYCEGSKTSAMSRRQNSRRGLHRDSQFLAYADGHPRHAGREARLCGKAGSQNPHEAEMIVAAREEIRARRADG